MTAATGAPLRVVVKLDGAAGEFEVQPPVPGTELVICPDCGFTWDADHTAFDDSTPPRVGYECPRCVLQALVAARQQVIEDTVRKGGKVLAQSLRLRVKRLEAACLAAVELLRQVDTGGPIMPHERAAKDALWAAGFNVDSRRPAPTSGKVAAQVAFARDAWRNDGAEGETVHALCDEIDRLTGQVAP